MIFVFGVCTRKLITWIGAVLIARRFFSEEEIALDLRRLEGLLFSVFRKVTTVDKHLCDSTALIDRRFVGLILKKALSVLCDLLKAVGSLLRSSGEFLGAVEEALLFFGEQNLGLLFFRLDLLSISKQLRIRH